MEDGSFSAVDLGLCSVDSREPQMVLSRGVVWSFEFPRDVLEVDAFEEVSKIRYKNRVDMNCYSSVNDKGAVNQGIIRVLSGNKCKRCFGSTKSGPWYTHCKGFG